MPSQNIQDVSSLALPTLDSQRVAEVPARPKSRLRLRSLSNASKRILAKLQGRVGSKEQMPPIPPVPATSRNLHRPLDVPTVNGPPPPYSSQRYLSPPSSSVASSHSRSSSGQSSSMASSSFSSLSTTSRPPLRERCHVQLSVSTKVPDGTSTTKEREAFFHDLNDQLVALSKLRATGPRFSLLSPINVSLPHPELRHSSLSHLHEVLPYLSVAFCDSRAQVPSKRFTHIIKLIYQGDEDVFEPGAQWEVGYTQHVFDQANGCLVLYHVVPRPTSQNQNATSRGRSRAPRRTTPKDPSAARRTRLNPGQLMYSRDFLSLALPYYTEAHPEAAFQRGFEDGESRSADRVRVLICAPKGYAHDNEEAGEDVMIQDEEASAADIVSIATCYLSYATGMPVSEVLGHFNGEESVPYVWKDAIADHPAGSRSGPATRVEQLGGIEYISMVVGKEPQRYACT